MIFRFVRFFNLFLMLLFPALLLAQTPTDSFLTDIATLTSTANNAPDAQHLTPVAELSGVEFVKNSTTQILLEKDGKRYLIDTATRQIHEIPLREPATAPEALEQTASVPTEAKASDSSMTAKKEVKKDKEVYRTEDIILWSIPTARHIDKHALYVDFAHRFSYDTTFVGPARLSYLFGMDDFSVSSFGLTYGLTNRFFVGAYRVPTVLGRELQFGFGAQLSQEELGQPFSSIVRVAVEGTNDFRNEYITSIEFAMARSIKKRAQLYFAPSISLNNRSLQDVIDLQFKGGGETTVTIGAGVSIDIRPTVAFVAEANPRVAGLLGVHRASFMLGVQKKIFRHSFTFGFTNSPGTTISQRSATRSGIYSGFNDSWRGLGIGFNISRRLF